MRVIFIIQGEGNGHLMQAAALKMILESRGYELIRVFQGGSFKKKCCPVRDRLISTTSYFLSPFFVTSKNRQGLNLWMTIILNILLIPFFVWEIIRIGLIIRNIKPDIVINFYDIIGGLALIFSGNGIRKFVISHHFFFEHPDFRWPADRKTERILLLIHSFLTSISTDKKLAVSFTPAENIAGKRLYIIPPLLRKEILEAQPVNHGHIHIYTLYPGYYYKLIDWCTEHPDIKIKMFSDFSELPVTNLQNLELHLFSTDKFIHSLITCNHVICTAGFETLAEAAFIGKPLEVVPSENHFEQYCNAVDLERSGLGIRKEDFQPFSEITETDPDKTRFFRDWVLKAEEMIFLYLDQDP